MTEPEHGYCTGNAPTPRLTVEAIGRMLGLYIFELCIQLYYFNMHSMLWAASSIFLIEFFEAVKIQ